MPAPSTRSTPRSPPSSTSPTARSPTWPATSPSSCAGSITAWWQGSWHRWAMPRWPSSARWPTGRPVRSRSGASNVEDATPSAGGTPVITLTDSAASKVKELLKAEAAEDLALRVAVRPGGCSGYSYEMFFEPDIAADDEQATFGDDAVKVVVDPASAQLLLGATLDYKDGLDASGFAI